MSSLTLIVAATRLNGIGLNGKLPWRLPQEMAYFVKVTTNAPEGSINAVLMGRNTWESIPTKFRPLQKRLNVVVSRNNAYTLAVPETSSTKAILSANLPSALKEIREITNHPVHQIFITGGAKLYTESLLLPPSSPFAVDRVLLTRILAPTFDECDVFMPDFENDPRMNQEGCKWEKASHEELREWVGFEVPEGVQEEKGVQYEFQMWVRKTGTT